MSPNPQNLLARLPAPEAVRAERWRRQQNQILRYYPEAGPLRRQLYPKQLEFFRAGATHRERLMLAANRVGKTEGVGAYETTLHLTGRYPDWWEGRRFDDPIDAWAAGDTASTVKDIIQEKLLGRLLRRSGDAANEAAGLGTGMIPGDLIRSVRPRAGVTDAIEVITVQHVSGGTSVLSLKSYEQGRTSFQGTRRHLIWLDEEPPLEIYTECLLRTMTCEGIVILTFTPLKGLSDVVQAFLPGGV